MDRLAHKRKNQERRQRRARQRISGTPKRPRLAATISNMHASAQIIDDSAGRTLAQATSVGSKIKGTMTSKAEYVGVEIAKKAKKAGINQVVFDRAGRKYHGRLKALADKARSEGLEF